MRRTRLHQFLADRALEEGVEFHWGERITGISEEAVTTPAGSYPYRWLVGADGQNSLVRKWAGLNPRRAGRGRYGFCSHFRVHPWSDVAEVYWARHCQIFVTPMTGGEVCVAVISRDPGLRLTAALPHLPALADRLRGATRTTRESEH